MATLEARNLVQELGRAESVGHPMRYGVSFEFLRYFGLKGVSELPPVEHLEVLPKVETPALAAETGEPESAIGSGQGDQATGVPSAAPETSTDAAPQA
jgi:segregation and condensation protein B